MTLEEQQEFEPQPGDVGSWVLLPDGRRGQVWSRAVSTGRLVVAEQRIGPPDNNRRPWCIVATGADYVAIALDDLLEAQQSIEDFAFDFGEQT